MKRGWRSEGWNVDERSLWCLPLCGQLGIVQPAHSSDLEPSQRNWQRHYNIPDESEERQLFLIYQPTRIDIRTQPPSMAPTGLYDRLKLYYTGEEGE